MVASSSESSRQRRRSGLPLVCASGPSSLLVRRCGDGGPQQYRKKHSARLGQEQLPQPKSAKSPEKVVQGTTMPMGRFRCKPTHEILEVVKVGAWDGQ